MVKNKANIKEGVTAENLDRNIEEMGGEVEMSTESLDRIIKEMGREITVYKIQYRMFMDRPSGNKI